MSSKTSLALASILTLAEALPNPFAHEEYQRSIHYTSYLALFNKQYTDLIEFRNHMDMFTQTSEVIRNHNSRQGISFFLGHNNFSDMTLYEKQHYFGYIEPHMPAKSFVNLKENYENTKDWRTEGAVGHIRDQGLCKADWAFAVASTLESAYFIKS